ELRGAKAGGLRFHIPRSWALRAGEVVSYVLAIGREESPPPERGSGSAFGDATRHDSDSGERGSCGAGGGATASERVERAVIHQGVERVGDDGWLTIALVPPPAPGYYHATVEISASSRRAEARQRLIVVPDRCVT